MDFHNLRMEVSLDLPVLNSVFYIWTNPILHFFGDFSASMDQGDSGAGPVEFQGGNGGGVLRTDHGNVLVIIRMRFFVVVDHLREVFSRDVQQVGDIVIPGGEDDLARHVGAMAAVTVGAVHAECPIVARHVIYFLVLVDIQLVVIRHAAVVLERLSAVGLLVQAGHRDVADFKQLRSREERHVGGVIVERVRDAALFDEDRIQAAPLEFDAAGEACRPGAHHHRFERSRRGTHSLFSTSAKTCSRAPGSAAASLPPPSAMSGRPPPLQPTACATMPTSFPACTLAVRSLVTAEMMEMLESSADANTTIPVFHLLRSESASARNCWRSMPSSRAASTRTFFTVRA